MGVPTAPKLDFVSASETTIDVAFVPLSDESVSSYELWWKEYPQTWKDGKFQPINESNSQQTKSKKIRATAKELNPCCTYSVRLVALDKDGNRGNPGPDLVIDTDAVGCTPEPKCVIL